MKRKNSKHQSNNVLIGLLTLLTLVLILWDMSLFRKTIIPFYIPLLFLFIGGISLYLVFWKMIGFYSKQGHSKYFTLPHGIFLFGTPLMTGLLAINFYFSAGKVEFKEVKVLEKGISAGRRSEVHYADVDYFGTEKKLTLSHAVSLTNLSRIILEIKRGRFGFEVIKGMKMIYESNDFQEGELIYQKLLKAADKHFTSRNYVKAKELYKRALTFKVGDQGVIHKLAEIDSIQKLK